MPLFEFNYNINEEEVLHLYYSNQSRLAPYKDPRYSKAHPDWHILRMESVYFEKVFKDLGVEGRPRFYYLKKYAFIPPHVDSSNLCSINFILGDLEPAPIRIEGKDYFYRQAVLNTTKIHEVQNGSKDRILLKFSIFDLTYEQVVKKIQNNLKICS